MLQQVLALILIAFFVSRLFWQKKKGTLGANEYIFWLFFWILSAIAIIFIKYIDQLVETLGFTGSGIDVLIYFGVVFLFYLIFRLRLRLEKMEKNITKIVRDTAINNKLNNK